MLFVLLPESAATLEALAARALEALPGFTCAMDPDARERADRRSHGGLCIRSGRYALTIVERRRRGIGGENRDLLRRAGGPALAASALPRRWELFERDEDDAYGNAWALVLDCIADAVPGAWMVDPRDSSLVARPREPG
jgi:hypothetical protein